MSLRRRDKINRAGKQKSRPSTDFHPKKLGENMFKGLEFHEEKRLPPELKKFCKPAR